MLHTDLEPLVCYPDVYPDIMLVALFESMSYPRVGNINKNHEESTVMVFRPSPG